MLCVKVRMVVAHARIPHGRKMPSFILLPENWTGMREVREALGLRCKPK